MYPSDLIANTGFYGEGSVSMDLSYEHILFPLDNFFTQCVPVGTVWTYTQPTTAITVPNHYTLEIGALDAVADAGYDADGVLFTELNISGEAGGVWTCLPSCRKLHPWWCALVMWMWKEPRKWMTSWLSWPGK